jgi:hypothetical protein
LFLARQGREVTVHGVAEADLGPSALGHDTAHADVPCPNRWSGSQVVLGGRAPSASPRLTADNIPIICGKAELPLNSRKLAITNLTGDQRWSLWINMYLMAHLGAAAGITAEEAAD